MFDVSKMEEVEKAQRRQGEVRLVASVFFDALVLKKSWDSF